MVKTHKYICKTCDYRTNDKRDLGKHKQTKKHCANNMICFNCKAQYKRLNHYNHHMDTMPCVKDEGEKEQSKSQTQTNAESAVINGNHNSLSIVHGSTIDNRTINNTNIFQLDTRTLSGEMFKQACRLLTININPLMHDDSIARCRALIEKTISDDFSVLDVLDTVEYTAEEASQLFDKEHKNRLREKYKPIAKQINSLRSKGLDLMPFCELINDQAPKIWFNPSLITEEDLTLMPTLDIERAHNNTQIDAYAVRVIAKAIVETYLNKENPKGQSFFCDTPRDIFYKDESNGLPVNYLSRLTKDTMDILLNEIFTVNNIIFRHLNDYHVEFKSVNVDYRFIYNTISSAFYDIVGIEKPLLLVK